MSGGKRRVVRVRAEIEFEITEGRTRLKEHDQLSLLLLIMEQLPQHQVILQGPDPLMDDPALVLEPMGWAVDTDKWGDLAVGSLMGAP